VSDPLPPLGENFSRELKRTGLTTTQAAYHLDVSERQVRRWMTGTSSPSWQNLLAWARLFDRTADWFYAWHDEDDREPNGAAA
jgi:transcriptional regulator with XRE-family HTH domain